MSHSHACIQAPAPSSDRQLSKAFLTRCEARLLESETLAARDRGGLTDPRAGNITVAQFAATWLAGLAVRPATARSYGSHVRLYIVPGLGTMKMANVRRAHVQRWARGLPLSPATSRQVLTTLRVMLNEAAALDVIVRNPASRVTVAQGFSESLPLLEPEQIIALAAAIRPDLEAAIWLGAGCGLRIGETLGLRVWTLTGSDGKYTSPSSAAGSR